MFVHLNSLLIIYLYLLSDLMNHWQLKKNALTTDNAKKFNILFRNDKLIIQYENTIIKHIIDMLKSRIKPL